MQDRLRGEAEDYVEGSPTEREYIRREEYIQRAIDHLSPETGKTWFDNYPDEALSLFAGNVASLQCNERIGRIGGGNCTHVVESSRRRRR